jgi:exonuclease SbcD
MAVDFGEQNNTNVVCLVQAAPGTPARVTDIPVTAGRRLRTVRGTVAELAAQVPQVGEDFLRVWVREPARAGLRDEVLELLPNALEIRIDPEFSASTKESRPSSSPVERSPGELFAEFCAARSVADPRVTALFDRLHDKITGGS